MAAASANRPAMQWNVGAPPGEEVCKPFGRESVLAAIEAMKKGRIICVTDDESRENEGDLIMAGEFATPEAIGFIIRYSSGVICCSVRDPPFCTRYASHVEVDLVCARSRCLGSGWRPCSCRQCTSTTRIRKARRSPCPQISSTGRRPGSRRRTALPHSAPSLTRPPDVCAAGDAERRAIPCLMTRLMTRLMTCMHGVVLAHHGVCTRALVRSRRLPAPWPRLSAAPAARRVRRARRAHGGGGRLLQAGGPQAGRGARRGVQRGWVDGAHTAVAAFLCPAPDRPHVDRRLDRIHQRDVGAVRGGTRARLHSYTPTFLHRRVRETSAH